MQFNAKLAAIRIAGLTMKNEAKGLYLYWSSLSTDERGEVLRLIGLKKNGVTKTQVFNTYHDGEIEVYYENLDY